ncbi:MAG: hypothetical protein AAF845_05545 [Bacteroidota bacterium]
MPTDLHSALARIAEARPEAVYFVDGLPATSSVSFLPRDTDRYGVTLPSAYIKPDGKVSGEGALMTGLLALARSEGMNYELGYSDETGDHSARVYIPTPSSQVQRLWCGRHPDPATALALALAQFLDSETP